MKYHNGFKGQKKKKKLNLFGNHSQPPSPSVHRQTMKSTFQYQPKYPDQSYSFTVATNFFQSTD